MARGARIARNRVRLPKRGIENLIGIRNSDRYTYRDGGPNTKYDRYTARQAEP